MRYRTTEEWLEPDGLGGFASGTVTGERTRRYHALLLVSQGSPTDRVVLVSGYEACVRIGHHRYWLSTQRYLPDLVRPEGPQIAAFHADPWPTWRYRLTDHLHVLHEILVPHGARAVALRWQLDGYASSARLEVRPLLSGRPFHRLHRENPAFRFDAHSDRAGTVWHPYRALPSIACRTNGLYTHRPVWYRNLLYQRERAGGVGCVEDLASPGAFSWDLLESEAAWILCAEPVAPAAAGPDRAGCAGGPASDAVVELRRIRERELRRRRWFPTSLHRAADAYLIRSRARPTVISAYPWAGEDGRHTFIALRGLCLATGRLTEAARILERWAGTLAGNRGPSSEDAAGTPRAEPADAALWFIVACGEFRGATDRWDLPSRGLAARLEETVQAILACYADGARPGVRLDDDGLLAVGEPRRAMTWMDATVGDRPVTPRVGKPVEVQALWLSALEVGRRSDRRWGRAFARARRAFHARFWNPELGYLFDVVDVNHEPGIVDPSLRPNQILAVGGLPVQVLDGERGRAVVDIVERRLWTRLGLRGLDREDPAYRPCYTGSVEDRGLARHQGPAWCWLLGPFIEAWLRVRGGTLDARREARRRFIEPILLHLGEGGLGHVSELTDAEPPHAPRGAPFHACSVGEALRILQTTTRSRRGPPAPPDRSTLIEG